MAELVRAGYADVKPGVMKRLSLRYPVLEAEVVFAVQQVCASARQTRVVEIVGLRGFLGGGS